MPNPVSHCIALWIVMHTQTPISLSETIVTCLYMLYSVVVVFANSVPTAVKPTLGCTSWCCWTTCRLWALRTVKAARSHSKRECCQFCLSAEQDFTASSCPTFQESTSQVNEQCFLNSLLLLQVLYRGIRRRRRSRRNSTQLK